MGYFGNLLNQYTGVRNVSAGAGQGRLYDIDGNLIELYVAGDVDQDGDVDEDDLTDFWDAWSTCSGDPNYNPYADMDGDNCIGIGDYSLLASYLGGEAEWVVSYHLKTSHRLSNQNRPELFVPVYLISCRFRKLRGRGRRVLSWPGCAAGSSCR